MNGVLLYWRFPPKRGRGGSIVCIHTHRNRHKHPHCDLSGSSLALHRHIPPFDVEILTGILIDSPKLCQVNTINRSYLGSFTLKIHLRLQIELGWQCVFVLWCETTHVCTTDVLITMTDTEYGNFYICIVLKMYALGVVDSFFLPSSEFFWIPVQIPLSKHFSLCRDLLHLAQQTLLIEHVAGGTVACLCDISIYLLFWILFLNWDEKIRKKMQYALVDISTFRFFLSNFRGTKWLDIMFYTSGCLLGFQQLKEKRWESTAFPRGYACRGHKTSIILLMPYTLDLCWYDKDLSNVFEFRGELNDMKHSLDQILWNCQCIKEHKWINGLIACVN